MTPGAVRGQAGVKMTMDAERGQPKQGLVRFLNSATTDRLMHGGRPPAFPEASGGRCWIAA